ncbi:glycoside hydrolase/deacetylase [Dichomitus squalens LYAD-421 SS1]|uniref:Glycoside hydrolase/deacetylase n=1 Tax=Dichomitus squalens (strain LYAD-421) TaxID=732165 RepID=R7T189_DICSQ|nr:glycoside hydrolase/deacetylase [Dichomitus squalens LYAD-421 SS1]EJF62169.1 glycoside hydrolase/deacetylase [Dichomitus squalens LYAD-421 SS1]
MPRKILIGFGVDADAASGWIGSLGAENSPVDVSRGIYAGEVGIPRLLRLFAKYNIKTTWFIPGHSLETFPEQMAAVRDAGHEIGLHGYLHERQSKLTVEQQKDVLDRAYDVLTKFNNGVPPKGSCAPCWDTARDSAQLLVEKGIEYGHSQAYYLRIGDDWTKIDYQAKAETWMKPLVRGTDTGLVEIPANWYLDDWPPLIFVRSAGNSSGWVNTRDVEQLWKDMFTYLYRGENFIFPITIHPDVSGRPHVLMMLERFIDWVNTHDDVQWVRMIDMANEFRGRVSPAANAIMPQGLAT